MPDKCLLQHSIKGMLQKVVLTFESEDEILKCGHSSDLATKQCFPAVLFIILFKVVLNF